MIGVIPKDNQAPVVEEFFELFKTPWEFYRPGRAYDVVIATGGAIPDVCARLLLVYGPEPKGIDARLGIAAGGQRRNRVLACGKFQLPVYGDLLTFAPDGHRIHCTTGGAEVAGLGIETSAPAVIRLGYDLFDEVGFLLSTGQPVEHAHIPTLEIHIEMLREWILGAGVPLMEIPPVPAGYSFAACLTHDIDFVGIRRHKFDHTMWGFVYRATAGALRNVLRGRLALAQMFQSWLAVLSLPLVYLGWATDFWEPFDWYLDVEKGLPATYFLIPFKRRAGAKVPGRGAARRATAYDIGDLSDRTRVLIEHGCEVGTHGIDAWHDSGLGRAELAATRAAASRAGAGIRMHWLLADGDTPSVLESAGFAYDSTCGFNDTVGYRAGTGQVFRPAGAQTLLELPLHIQDGALFYPKKLDLPEPEAQKRCQALIDNARRFGGALTLLWHDRSHAAERFWGGFYVRLIEKLKSLDCWFGTATQVVGWFGKRRLVRFERVEGPGSARTRICYDGEEIEPPLTVRLWPACEGVGVVDIPWNGSSLDPIDLGVVGRPLGETSESVLGLFL